MKLTRRSLPALQLAVLATALSAGACRNDELDAIPGDVKGRFCEPETGAGLGRVEVAVFDVDGVELEEKHATGDVNGGFLVSQLRPGDYRFVGTLGPVTREQNVTVESQRVVEFVDVGCHDPPPPPPPTGGVVTGRECDQGVGQWVGFAQVWLSTPGNAGDVQYPGITDTDGSFEIVNVRPGTYDFHAVKDSWFHDEPMIVVTEGGTTTVPGPATCDPPPAGSIEGRVCKDGEGWLADARAYVNLPGGQVLEDMTDTTGAFTIAAVPPGTHVVRVEKDVFFRSFSVTVMSGQVAQAPSPAQCNVIPPPPETGTVAGRVCAPDGETWLAGATVYVGTQPTPVAQTTTDAEGRYTLTGVPAGTHTVTVVKNSFTATYTVTVTADQTTTIPEDQCHIIPTMTSVAVVAGRYDNVRCVLTGQNDPAASRPGDPCMVPGLGLDPANVTTIDGMANSWADNFLGSYATMAQYDVIFFNCGVEDRRVTTSPNKATFAANLRQFVEQGGSIYASDWAAPLVELAFPEFISWQGGATSGDNVELAKVGDPQQVVANVVDPGIRAALGQQTVDVSFDLPSWVAMYGTAPATRVYIRGSATGFSYATFQAVNMNNIPLTAGFDVGTGRVIFTSFHQERNITPDMLAVLNLLVFEL